MVQEQQQNATNGATPRSSPVKQPLAHFSHTGLKRTGGKIFEDFLPELRFPYGIRNYEEMRKNSGIVGGFLRAVEASFRSVEWMTVPADDDPVAIKNAAFAESCRNDLRGGWNGYTTNALTVLPFGFAPLEMVFKRREGRSAQPYPSKYSDGKIGFAEFPLIGQDTIQDWIWDETHKWKLNGLIQLSPPDYERIEVPRDKFMLFRTSAEKDNPEGVSLLRTGYYHYYSMIRLEALEAIALERTGAGIPVMKLPRTASTIAENADNSDEAAAIEIVRSVRIDEQGGIVLPADWEFELARPAGRFDPQTFDLAIKRHRSNLLMSVLAVFLELGTARVGSFALAEQGRGFFETAFEGYVVAFEEPYNEEALPLLFELNGITDNLPKLTHTTIAGSNIEAISRSVQNMTTAGWLDPTDPLIANYLKLLLRLPRGDTVKELEAMSDPEERQRLQEEAVVRKMEQAAEAAAQMNARFNGTPKAQPDDDDEEEED